MSTLLHHLHSLAARQASGALPDRQLLEAFLAQRSEASFAALVQRHGPMVLSVCRRVLHNHHDAEDAFQATFLIFARKAAAIRKRESISSFLHGVAYHVAQKLQLSAARRAARERTQARPPFDEPGDDIPWRELRSVLDEELAKLPQEQRAPLVLCYLEGKTQDEAARLLGWSRSTFSRRLEQSRDALGRRLTRRGVTLSAALSVPLLTDVGAQAALPSLLTAGTIRAGMAATRGQAIAPLVSSQVAALAEGGMSTLLAKKASIALALLGMLMLSVGGFLAHRAVPGGTFVEVPAAPPAPLPIRSASTDHIIEIKGLVLGPDGKPFEGASVYLWTNAAKTQTSRHTRVTTDPEGRFRLSIREDDRRNEEKIVAAARNHGADWVELKGLKPDESVTLRLVKDDVPVQGRILNLEGHPVARATIRMVQLHQTDLDWWLTELKRGRWYYPKAIAGEALDAPAQATTGADGRFQLRGLGCERLVYLEISGETIERVRCWTMTRARKMTGLSGHGEAIYNATFDHFAGPSKPIVGTVREKGTGKPLAGVTVRFSGRQWVNKATTDEQGKYRLVGAAKQQHYALAAAGAPYFAATKRDILDTPGFDPITVDFELERGIEIRGRVINKVTGEPVQAAVTYHALSDSPHLKEVSGLDEGSHADDRNHTRPDGSFFVVGLPGPGYLVVLAEDDDYVKFGKPADGEKVVPYVNLAPPLVHAWVRINPSEKDRQTTHFDLALEPAQPIPGKVLDPNSKPVGGYFVAGLTGSPRHHSYEMDLQKNPSFRVRGFDSKRPRTLVFFHPEKKLAKVQSVREAPHSPLEVRLAPLSIATGRVLDARNRPWAGLRIHARLSQKPEDFADIPFELVWDAQWRKRVETQGITDADGKFRLDGLIPGLKYVLEVREGEGDSPVVGLPVLESWNAAEAGKRKDLGDLKSKRTPEKEP